jgi:SAM-dependent methyltransferase
MAQHEFYDDFHLYYDQINAAREGEHAYFRQVLAPRDTVLEVACGSGTLTATFAAVCAEVVGIDLSERMLDLARSRLPGVVFHCCDMRDFDLGRRFSRVICAFNSLMHMLTDRDAIAALRRLRAHCLPEGEVILDLFDLDPRFFAPATSGVPVLDRIDPVSGRHLRAEEDSVFDPARRVLTVTLRLLNGRTGQELQRSSTAMRFFAPVELARLLDAAGLQVLSVQPNHARDPAQPRTRQIVHARPAPDRHRNASPARYTAPFRKEPA